MNDSLWIHGQGAVSLTSLVDDKDSLRSACRNQGDVGIFEDDCDPGGYDTDKESVSLPRKISVLRGEKIVVPPPPLLPSSPVRPTTGEKGKPVTHDDGRESKVREQLVRLQGLNSPEGVEGSGLGHHEDCCLPNLAELDATPAALKGDVLAVTPISPTTSSSECNGDASNYDDEEEDSMSIHSPNERTPQRRPEYINLPIDLGDEQFSTAIAEALGYDRSPAGEELIRDCSIADDQVDTLPGDARDFKAPVNARDMEIPWTELPLETSPTDDPPPAQASCTREQVQREPRLAPPKEEVQISQPPSPVPESSISEILLSDPPRTTEHGATSSDNPVMDATGFPSSSKNEKNETLSIFSDLENLALASQRFASPPAHSFTPDPLKTSIPSQHHHRCSASQSIKG